MLCSVSKPFKYCSVTYIFQNVNIGKLTEAALSSVQRNTQGLPWSIEKRISVEGLVESEVLAGLVPSRCFCNFSVCFCI